MGKEALDDYQRYLRDKESNSTRYLILDRSVSQNVEDGLLTRSVSSAKLKVGDMVVLEKNMRIPADMVLLRTSEGPAGSSGSDGQAGESDLAGFAGESGAQAEGAAVTTEILDGDEGGACFVRTDQLDGETDWKLRIAVTVTQPMSDSELVRTKGSLYGTWPVRFVNWMTLLMLLDYPTSADPPIKDIHTFIGNITVGTSVDHPDQSIVVPLSADNVLWANTVLATGSAVGMVVYTGKETRASMNTSEPESKVGLLDIEINRMAKVSPCISTRSKTSKPLMSLDEITIGSMHRHVPALSPSGRSERI